VQFDFSLDASSDAKASLKSFASFVSLKPLLKKAAKLVAETELSKFETVQIQIVLLSDAELLEINRTSLDHDYLTDIITFEIERTKTTLESEIYISVDRAKENAKRFRAEPARELEHLVIHGMLHLAGMRDKTTAEMNQMRRKERWFLAKLDKAQMGQGQQTPALKKKRSRARR
jgi:probable rRNA maturation factor